MSIEGYIGDGLSIEEYDARMIRIRGEWVEEERSLFACKWFDYRHLHPTQATYLYTHHFIKAWRHHYAINIDRAATEGPTPIRPFGEIDVFTQEEPLNAAIRVDLKKLEIYQAREKTPQNDKLIAAANERIAAAAKKVVARRKVNLSGLWRGRMIADMMGMPYDLFCHEAIEFRCRRWQQKSMPPATHLYELGHSIEALDKRWTSFQAGRVIHATTPHYLNENFVGTQAQNDHHEWLFSLAAMRENPAPILARFVNEDILPMEKIGARLGIDMIDKVRAYS